MNILNHLLLHRRKSGKKKLLLCKTHIYIFPLNLFDYPAYTISTVLSIYLCNTLPTLVDLSFCSITFMSVLPSLMSFSIKGNSSSVSSCVIGINMGSSKSWKIFHNYTFMLKLCQLHVNEHIQNRINTANLKSINFCGMVW